MNLNSLEELEINPSEYCFIMENSNINSDSFKVIIPKIMPLLSIDSQPIIQRINFNNKIFINDPDTLPSTSNYITTQNYIVVPRSQDSWFKFRPDTIFRKTKLLCKIINKNIKEIYLTDEVYDISNAVKTLPYFLKNPAFEILDQISVGDSVLVSYSSNGNLASGKFTVNSKYDWGVQVYINGYSRDITPTNIIGVYKNSL